MPEGGVVGHAHLQVGDTAAAERFYGDLLGFEVTCRYPGGSFFGAGGYHHQLAANTWNSRGAGKRRERMTGLDAVELVTRCVPVIEVTLKDGRSGALREAFAVERRLDDPGRGPCEGVATALSPAAVRAPARLPPGRLPGVRLAVR